MATSPINMTQPMRETEQAIAKYLNNTVAPYMIQETEERKEADATEQERAEAAEQKLTADLATEQERAEAAEQKLTADLATEVNNRESAINDLKADLSSETSARQDADSLLQGNIDLVNDKFPIKTDNIGAAQVTKDKMHESLQLLLTYCETLPDFEFGYTNVGNLAAGSKTTVTVTFGAAKTEAPVIFATPVANGASLNLTCYTQYTTTTNAVIVVVNNDSTATASNVTLDYLAVSGR